MLNIVLTMEDYCSCINGEAKVKYYDKSRKKIWVT